VLYRSNPPSNLVRHRCRNPRCGAKLKRPTEDRLDAFCCQGCFDGFYRFRCLVCEQSIRQQPKRRRLVCTRSKCRHEFQRHRERFRGARYPTSVLGLNDARSAHFTGLKIGSLAGRPYRQIAGPELNPTSLRLASLPLDPDTAARIRRANERVWVDTAEIPTPTWPVVVMGGGDRGHELVHQARQLKAK
jgi:hypothetical protein